MHAGGIKRLKHRRFAAPALDQLVDVTALVMRFLRKGVVGVKGADDEAVHKRHGFGLRETGALVLRPAGASGVGATTDVVE